MPSTLLGALRSGWGRGLEAARGRALTREEWPTLTSQVSLGASFPLRRVVGQAFTPDHRMWPVPADAVAFADGVRRLTPRPPRSEVEILGTPAVDPADALLDAARERLWRPHLEQVDDKPVAGAAWWTECDFVRWLLEEELAPLTPSPADALGDVRGVLGQQRRRGRIPSRTDVHLAIDPEHQTAVPHMLYAMEVLETLVRRPGGAFDEWAIGLGVELPPGGDLRGPLLLGGKSRPVRLEPTGSELLAAPARLLEAWQPACGLRVFTATPACFDRGWLPDGFEPEPDGTFLGRIPGLASDLRLKAACVGRPAHVSGWDMARGRPKPTLRLVPAGSVYFFVRADGAPFTRDDAAQLWFGAWGALEHTSSGYGRVVAGRWTPESER